MIVEAREFSNRPIKKLVYRFSFFILCTWVQVSFILFTDESLTWTIPHLEYKHIFLSLRIFWNNLRKYGIWEKEKNVWTSKRMLHVERLLRKFVCHFWNHTHQRWKDERRRKKWWKKEKFFSLCTISNQFLDRKLQDLQQKRIERTLKKKKSVKKVSQFMIYS